MNDRFKFRYFNKYANKMVEPENWQNVDGIYECIKQQVCFDEDIAPLPYDHMGNGLVFMLCTGLKDKNGKLIYEGDILKDKYEALHPISWNVKGFYEADTFAVAGFYNAILEDMEVIGNIYENKSLLESEG